MKAAQLEQDKAAKKAALVNDYCSAMEDKVFTARKNLFDGTLKGKPCIEVYNEAYRNPLAAKFDPISREIAPRSMCSEFVKEINVLLDQQKANLNNALRYSYLIT